MVRAKCYLPGFAVSGFVVSGAGVFFFFGSGLGLHTPLARLIMNWNEKKQEFEANNLLGVIIEWE